MELKAKSVNDAEEAVTSAEFHKWIPYLFTYSTSKGFLHLCDFRERALFESGSSLKFEVGAGFKKNPFSEMINCISKAKFLSNADYLIATRDYLTVKLWDIWSTE